MPPKRRASGQVKSNQSTLAFHGASNKVTKSGTRSASAKNISDEASEKNAKPDSKEVVVIEETEEPTMAEAAIIEQIEQAQSTPEEDEARKITAKKIQAYWRIESQSLAPRAHQKDLSLEQKILRKFDTSGHYGPCVGIARLKRWQRAHRLGLEPPMEVLAVLLNEQEEKDKLTVQKSYMDELLNPRTEVEP
ncbi:hypothetical protein P280DRAFT_417041 [Massarina eburnea CBS 473.64]|uniref:DNA polymerase delta subunit 4 n=1 Tax=Massarina eburnea CBS 473.64 TaxID=1395130 RepID=A0A6A6SC83_9PLEO|nr:hypothetical protein P280DRAFT_417041 [Massarina eburnea CBS 473.64]